tara:strand:+ start:28 stop:879 length:852 start_codon:yes stop_codon:yes gene_type:complete
MKDIIINFYNRRSAKKLGWAPNWFATAKFDSRLIKQIKDFQAECDLKQDGMVGPMTFRRLVSLREAQEELVENSLLVNGAHVPIKWDKVKIDLLGSKCYRKSRKRRVPKKIVTHWDVCLSADSCRNVLEKRGISTHFVIDNDGTIVQLVDTNDIAWHASGANNYSVGIDLSNAYYTKYQRVYEKRGHGPRPVIKSQCHGQTLGPHLGYYPVQIEAYKALLSFLSKHYNIPLECPQNDDGTLITTVYPEAKLDKYRGVVCHYHLTRKKIDTAGLELVAILGQIH